MFYLNFHLLCLICNKFLSFAKENQEKRCSQLKHSNSVRNSTGAFLSNSSMNDLTQMLHRTGSLTRRQASRCGPNGVWVKSAIEKEHKQAKSNVSNESIAQFASIIQTTTTSGLDQSLNECDSLSRRPSGRFANRNKLAHVHRFNHQQLSMNNLCSISSNATNPQSHPSDYLINYVI